MARWYGAMREPVERHGGTVEKFIGDAVMAVFGVPHVHEDDALRAVRAAVEMRDALARLNEELAGEGRPQLRIRIGVNSGEVVTGDHATTLVTGDAVNTAKRLEEAAGPDEILIGDATRRLVENAAVLEPSAPVEAKGKRKPVAGLARARDDRGRGAVRPAHRHADRRPRAPSCAVLRDRARRGRARALLPPRHRARRGGDRQVAARVRAAWTRSPPRGDGADGALSPLRRRDHVLAAARARPLRRRRPTRSRRRVAGRARPRADPRAHVRAHRLGARRRRAEETFWAVRRVLETLARDRPLVVWFEDIHWAEPTLLDLRRVRRRLVPRRADPAALPGAAGAAGRAPRLARRARRVADARAAERRRVRRAARRARRPARGRSAARGSARRPRAIRSSSSRWSRCCAEDPGETAMPPTIQALLAARLDRLAPLERSVLERASVARARSSARRRRRALARRDERSAVGAVLLVAHAQGPDRAGTNAGARRRRLPLPPRADSRRGVSRSAESGAREPARARSPRCSSSQRRRAEELVGYHLEQAYRYRDELGARRRCHARDRRARRRAARRGRTARVRARGHARCREPARARAAARRLLRSGPPRAPARAEHGALVDRRGRTEPSRLLDDLIATAVAMGDSRQQWYGLVERAARRDHLRRRCGGRRAARRRRATRFRCSRRSATTPASRVRGAGSRTRTQLRLRYGAAEDAALLALGHAESRAKRRRRRGSSTCSARASCTAPTPADEAVARGARPCSRTSERARWSRRTSPSRSPVCSRCSAGSTRRAPTPSARSRSTESSGQRCRRRRLDADRRPIELLAGDPAAAERHLRQGFDLLDGGAGSQELSGVTPRRGALPAAARTTRRTRFAELALAQSAGRRRRGAGDRIRSPREGSGEASAAADRRGAARPPAPRAELAAATDALNLLGRLARRASPTCSRTSRAARRGRRRTPRCCGRIRAARANVVAAEAGCGRHRAARVVGKPRPRFMVPARVNVPRRSDGQGQSSRTRRRRTPRRRKHSQAFDRALEDALSPGEQVRLRAGRRTTCASSSGP